MIPNLHFHYRTKARKLFEEIQFWKQPTLRCQIVLLRDSKDFSNLFGETQVSFFIPAKKTRQKRRKIKTKKTLTKDQEITLFQYIIQCSNENRKNDG
jgi:hypothetical protein